MIETKTKASTRKKNLTPSQQLSTFHILQVLTTPFAWMRSYRFVCNVLCCLPLICVGLLERLVSLSFPQLQTATPAWSPPPYLSIPYHTILAGSPPTPQQAWLLRYKSQFCVLANYCNVELVQRCPRIILQKNCLLTRQRQACSRITRLFGWHHAENGLIHRKMIVDCPLVITSKVERKEE